MNNPKEVTLIEVGPRDGLQNESAFVPTAAKVALINALSHSGLKNIEVTSFVSPKAIPQLADGEAVLAEMERVPGVRYCALVPNEAGMQRALAAGVDNIAIFTAASEQFNQRNIRCSIAESIERFRPVMALAKAHGVNVRAYVSCVLGCPYEGEIKPAKVAEVTAMLLELGAGEISLGDTIGVGTPRQTEALLKTMAHVLPAHQLAMHFHDTYGQAVANVSTSLDCGIRRFDSAVAGLGGCPYARGASGNVATEDLLYLMHGLGMETGIDIYQVVSAGDAICRVLQRKNQSKVANALLANPC